MSEAKTTFDVDAVIKKILDLREKPYGTYAGITDDEIRQITAQVTEVFKKESSLLEMSAPITVCGDIRGQIHDLLRIFDKTGYPPETRYLFLGNYADDHSVDTVCLLFCYKIKYPDRVFMLRGSYDCRYMMRIRGFYDEIVKMYGMNSGLFEVFSKCFEWLPFAAIVGEKVFCVHGGISPELESLDDIRGLQRPMETPDEGLACDLLYDSPDPDTDGWADNEEEVGYLFGSGPLGDFLKHFDFDLVVRAHQKLMGGYEFPFFPEQTLVSLFSAPNLRSEYQNRGAVMCIDEFLSCTFTTLEPETHQDETFGVQDNETSE